MHQIKFRGGKGNRIQHGMEGETPWSAGRGRFERGEGLAMVTSRGKLGRRDGDGEAAGR